MSTPIRNEDIIVTAPDDDDHDDRATTTTSTRQMERQIEKAANDDELCLMSEEDDYQQEHDDHDGIVMTMVQDTGRDAMEVTFVSGDATSLLQIEPVETSRRGGHGARIKAFHPGIKTPTLLSVGDVLIRINDERAEGAPFPHLLKKLQHKGALLVLVFVRPPPTPAPSPQQKKFNLSVSFDELGSHLAANFHQHNHTLSSGGGGNDETANQRHSRSNSRTGINGSSSSGNGHVSSKEKGEDESSFSFPRSLTNFISLGSNGNHNNSNINNKQSGSDSNGSGSGHSSLARGSISRTAQTRQSADGGTPSPSFLAAAAAAAAGGTPPPTTAPGGGGGVRKFSFDFGRSVSWSSPAGVDGGASGVGGGLVDGFIMGLSSSSNGGSGVRTKIPENDAESNGSSDSDSGGGSGGGGGGSGGGGGGGRDSGRGGGGSNKLDRSVTSNGGGGLVKEQSSDDVDGEKKPAGWRQLTSRLMDGRSALGDLSETFKDKLEDVVKELTRAPSKGHMDMFGDIIKAEEDDGGGAEAEANSYLSLQRMVKEVSVQLENELVVVRVGGSLMATGTDENDLCLTWLRASEGGSFTPLEHVTGYSYVPSADDYGARICVQASIVQGSGGARHRDGSKDDALPPAVGFAEVGPIQLAETLQVAVDDALQKGQISFERLELINAEGVSFGGGGGGGGGDIGNDSSSSSTAAAPWSSLSNSSRGGGRRRGGGGGDDDDGDDDDDDGGGGIGSAYVQPIDQTCTFFASAEDGIKVVGRESGTVLLECGYSAQLRVTLEASRSHVLSIHLDTSLLSTKPSGKVRSSPTSPNTSPPPRRGSSSVVRNPVIIRLRADSPSDKDVIAIVVRRWRLTALGPDITVIDYPEVIAAKQKEDKYYQMKLLAAKAWNGTDLEDDEDDNDDDDDDSECVDDKEEAVAVFRIGRGDGHRRSVGGGGGGGGGGDNADNDDDLANEDDTGFALGEILGELIEGGATERAGSDADNDVTVDELLANLTAARQECVEMKKMLAVQRDKDDAKEEARLQAVRDLKLATQELKLAVNANAVMKAEHEQKMEFMKGAHMHELDIMTQAHVYEFEKVKETHVRTTTEHIREIELLKADAADSYTKLTVVSDRSKVLASQLQTTKETLAGKNDQLDHIKGKMLQLKDVLEREEIEKRTIQTLEEQLKALQAQNARLAEEVTSARLMNEELLEQQRKENAEALRKETAHMKTALLAAERQLMEIKVKTARLEQMKMARDEASKQEIDSTKDALMDMEAQRNSLKAKADSMSKDLQKLTARQQAMTMDFRVQLSVMRAERDAAKDEFEELRLMLEQKIANDQHRGSRSGSASGGPSLGITCLCKEGGDTRQMERVTRTLEDSLKEKSIQLETAAQTNLALAEQIQELEQKLLDKSEKVGKKGKKGDLFDL